MNIESTIHPSCPWHDMEQQFGPANVKWCEERICAFINEPANAWSNVLFILVGLFLIYRGIKAKKTPMGKFDSRFGTIVVFMGVSSFIFHATNNFATQILDFIGMYFYIYFLLCISLYHFKLVTSRAAIYIFFGCVVVSTALIPLSVYIHFPYQAIVGVSALGLAFLQIKGWLSDKNYPKKHLLFCLGSFVIAAGFSYSDISRRFCDPGNHFIQGHAIWHIFGAIGTWFSYLVFSKQYQSSLKL
ncbi:MAG: ceramidase domain-containing protein [Bdellovibrionaceae bacterium]|nr:ceramidase domain-containing protein [Pseudobdellovibrionaceae bacterium]